MSDFVLGDKVDFNRSYHREVKRRFSVAWPQRTAQEPYPLVVQASVGVVVGKRHVIMKNLKYEPGSFDEGGYSTGDKETVLLVATSIYKEPILVRLEDAVKVDAP